MIKILKLNSRGFMLAEVVITSSVIAVTLVTLFVGLNKVKSSYERRNRYYDLDAQEIALEVNDYIVRNNMTVGVGDILNQLPEDEIDKRSEVEGMLDDFGTLLDRGVRVYKSNYNKNSLTSLIDSNSSLSFIDYIEYLKNNIDEDEQYKYFIIVETQNKYDEDDYYYYALKVPADCQYYKIYYLFLLKNDFSHYTEAKEITSSTDSISGVPAESQLIKGQKIELIENGFNSETAWTLDKYWEINNAVLQSDLINSMYHAYRDEEDNIYISVVGYFYNGIWNDYDEDELTLNNEISELKAASILPETLITVSESTDDELIVGTDNMKVMHFDVVRKIELSDIANKTPIAESGRMILYTPAVYYSEYRNCK